MTLIELIISSITKTIDIFTITVIAASAIQSILPTIISIIRSYLAIIPKKRIIDEKEKEEINIRNIKSSLRFHNFINGLLLALELESANAILKMGLFTFYATSESSNHTGNGNIENFIFFVALLSTRIAINQSIRKHSI